MGQESVRDMGGGGSALRTKVPVRVAGWRGAEEDVICGRPLIEVDGVRPGVRYRALEAVGKALIKLHCQTVVVAEARIVDLSDLTVFRTGAGAVVASRVGAPSTVPQLLHDDSAGHS